jgi:hypothetical protein
MLTPGMTKPQGDELAWMQEQTRPGMAHWSGSGPKGKTCRDCMFWGVGNKFRRDTWGELRPRQCTKFTRLSGGRRGDGVPHGCWACKYFEARPSSPEALRKREAAE